MPWKDGELKPHAIPRESLTALNDLPESLPIVRVLRNWFAEVPSLSSPIVNCYFKVMDRNGASDRWPTSLDCLHGGASRRMLKHNP